MPASLEAAQAWVFAFAEKNPGIMAIARVGDYLMIWGVVRDRRLRRGAL